MACRAWGVGGEGKSLLHLFSPLSSLPLFLTATCTHYLNHGEEGEGQDRTESCLLPSTTIHLQFLTHSERRKEDPSPWPEEKRDYLPGGGGGGEEGEEEEGCVVGQGWEVGAGRGGEGEGHSYYFSSLIVPSLSLLCLLLPSLWRRRRSYSMVRVLEHSILSSSCPIFPSHCPFPIPSIPHSYMPVFSLLFPSTF